MVRITLDLLRKRCEHNEGLIHNLEELSLHQDNLEEIENVDKWCKELKILYLQGNTIQKIENLNRLKNLEYLNLALNNIERLENLDRCESLRKLDLTANFIGELTSVENLQNNNCLEELFLTGNPCAEFEGYRNYVIGTLPQINLLDGQEISRTERIRALQNFLTTKASIIEQQKIFKEERREEKIRNLSIASEKDGENRQEWEKMSWSPEYRLEMARQREENNTSKNKKQELPTKAEIRLYDSSGVALNINQLKVNYSLEENQENGQLILDVPIYRYLDTSLIDMQIETTFVRITIKKKVFQIRLPEEISPDKCSVQRSTTTGNIRVILSVANQMLTCPTSKKKEEKSESTRKKLSLNEVLEVDPTIKKSADFNLIATPNLRNTISYTHQSFISSSVDLGRPDSPGFRDDFTVPLLE